MKKRDKNGIGSLLTINAGSSSLRLSLFEQHRKGLVQLAKVRHDLVNGQAVSVSLLDDFIASFDATRITLVVHRVVHGGRRLTSPCRIDARIEAEIERLIPLAPLHNPSALAWIRLTRQLLGEELPQMAVFDTAFYRSLPEVAATYALPRRLCRDHAIRRYGFHGIAHRALWNRWREIRPEIKDGGRVISLQLGAGCSITAIDRGVPVDTSMGFSPLEGLVMATRSGDLDPTLITYLQQEAGLSTAETEQLLNKQSGLLGLSGESGNMRAVLDSDNPDAQLAVNLYCYRIRKYIGAYLTVLGGADAILFGGGVGENSPQIRAKILHGMAWLGVELSPLYNDDAMGKETRISTTKSQIESWVITVDEARVMLQEALKSLSDD
ncbi:MAG: acetate/propionate family kinase [Candidatus Polarisedimenticolaceae bacterium]|nr:acetate/propionate family kinase [Candidatus Polarisedimenticolaceae bacterium]